MSTAVVLGGGISGLSAAHYLSRLAAVEQAPIKNIVLCEASSRVGGWLHSVRHDDGAVYELGPNSVRFDGKARSYNTLKLVNSLQLTNKILPISKSHPVAGKRYVQAAEKLYPLNVKGLTSMYKVVFDTSLWHVIRKETTAPSLREAEDETVHDFATRRFGEEAADYIFDPLCLGVYAGDSRRLSARSAFPDLWAMEKSGTGSVILSMVQSLFRRAPTELQSHEEDLYQKFCSEYPDNSMQFFDALDNDMDRFYELEKHVKQQRWAMWSLQEGLETLTEAMAETLLRNKNVEVRTGCECKRLEFVSEEDGVEITISGGEKIVADRVISAVPAWVLARMLAGEGRPHDTLSKLLGMVPAVSVALVHLEYAGRLPGVPQGFGYLVPSSEDSPLLGVIFASQIFPELSRTDAPTTRLVCMTGGTHFHRYHGNPQHADKDKILERTLNCFTFKEKPVRSRVDVLTDCIPQYDIGHHRIVAGLDNYINQHKLPLTLIGASYKGISVNDCIYNSRLEMLNLTRVMLAGRRRETREEIQPQVKKRLATF